jgi:hypothetical protein
MPTCPSRPGRTCNTWANLGAVGFVSVGRKALDRGGLGAVEQIEEFEIGVEPHPFPEIEVLGYARIEVDERGRNEVIAAPQEIHAVEMAVAIHVWRLYASTREPAGATIEL